jgi:hypothetical protein
MVRFQMKTSTRPQTIAVVKSQVDIQSFRSNPEWYEIKEEEVIPSISKPDKPVVTKPRKKE